MVVCECGLHYSIMVPADSNVVSCDSKCVRCGAINKAVFNPARGHFDDKEIQEAAQLTVHEKRAITEVALNLLDKVLKK